MDLRPIAIATAVLVFLLPAAPVSAAAPTPVAPSAEAAREAGAARTLIRNRRFDEALAVLRPLARGESVDAPILFLYGLAAIEAAQKSGLSEDARATLLDEAIAAFRTMLVARPELVRVRLELARAFFLKREDSLATRHFGLVLAGKPPAPVALNVNRFLNLMRARKRWEPAPRRRAGAGQQYRRRLGRTDNPYQRPPLPPRPGGADLIGRRHLGLGSAGSTSTRWATPERGPGQEAGDCARAATSRGRNTGRAGSTR